jgi:acyl carrier protein
MSELAQKIKTIVSEQLGVELSTVVEDAQFTEDLGADSLDTVELVMALEEAFDIEISDEAAQSVKKVGDVIRLIEEASEAA